MALGEGDPAVRSLKESLRQARLQAKVLPVEDRIEGIFIERSKKRIVALREEAQLIVQETEAKLVSEENALRDGELRLQTLEREAHGTPEPTRTPPADFAQELEQLRFRIVEAWFRREAEEDQIGGRSSSRSQRHACGGYRSEQSCRSIKFDGDIDRQGRRRVFREIQPPFQPDVMGLGADPFCFVICSRYGFRGVRVGEASHPGPPRLLRGVIPSQGELSAGDVVDKLPTTVLASQSPARMMHKNLWYRKLLARYALRAHRVGEASHPGPRTRNRCEGDHTGPSSHRVRRVPDSPEHDEACRGTQDVSGSRRRRRRFMVLGQ